MTKRTSERPVAGFNLVAVIGTEGICIHYDGTLRPIRFGAGVHVISSNRDLDDTTLPERHILDQWSASLNGVPGPGALTTFLSSHKGSRPVCKHGSEFGTVSSTIFIATPQGSRFLHADGPPCRTPFQDFTSLLPGGNPVP